MIETNDYHFSAAWDGNEIAYWAKVEEFPSLSFFADTREEALAGLRQAVTDILEDMRTTGEVPPAPRGSKPSAPAHR
jgi:predicted RNase H-like HicB family nuclease